MNLELSMETLKTQIKEAGDKKSMHKEVARRFCCLPKKEREGVSRLFDGLYTHTRSAQAVEAAMDAAEGYKCIPNMADWVAYQMAIGMQANDLEVNQLNELMAPILKKMASCYAIEPMIRLAWRLQEREHRRRLVFSYIGDIINLSYDKELTVLLAGFLLRLKPEFVEKVASMLQSKAVALWEAGKKEMTETSESWGDAAATAAVMRPKEQKLSREMARLMYALGNQQTIARLNMSKDAYDCGAVLLKFLETCKEEPTAEAKAENMSGHA